MSDEHRDAIRDRDCERNSLLCRDVSVSFARPEQAFPSPGMRQHPRAVYLSCNDDLACVLRELALKVGPPRHDFADWIGPGEPERSCIPRRRERPDSEALKIGDLFAVECRRYRRHFLRSSTRRISAPSAMRRSSMRSYPRSICPTLLMTLCPSAPRAAISNAIPARMSGESSVAPRSAEGPATSARCGSHNTIFAPIVMSLSTKTRRDSNIFSCIMISPSHCVAVTIAIDIVSAGNAGHG